MWDLRASMLHYGIISSVILFGCVFSLFHRTAEKGPRVLWRALSIALEAAAALGALGMYWFIERLSMDMYLSLTAIWFGTTCLPTILWPEITFAPIVAIFPARLHQNYSKLSPVLRVWLFVVRMIVVCVLLYMVVVQGILALLGFT